MYTPPSTTGAMLRRSFSGGSDNSPILPIGSPDDDSKSRRRGRPWPQKALLALLALFCLWVVRRVLFGGGAPPPPPSLSEEQEGIAPLKERVARQQARQRAQRAPAKSSPAPVPTQEERKAAREEHLTKQREMAKKAQAQKDAAAKAGTTAPPAAASAAQQAREAERKKREEKRIERKTEQEELRKSREENRQKEREAAREAIRLRAERRAAAKPGAAKPDAKGGERRPGSPVFLDGDKGGGGEGPPAEGCRDLPGYATHCKVWARAGECEKNKEFMHHQCAESCGQCGKAAPKVAGGVKGAAATVAAAAADRAKYGSDAPPGRGRGRKDVPPDPPEQVPTRPAAEPDDGRPCSDENELCPSWAAIGECQRNSAYMHVECRKSCGFCKGGSE